MYYSKAVRGINNRSFFTTVYDVIFSCACPFCSTSYKIQNCHKVIEFTILWYHLLFLLHAHMLNRATVEPLYKARAPLTSLIRTLCEVYKITPEMRTSPLIRTLDLCMVPAR